MLISQLPQALQISLAGRDHPCLTLHRFQHDRHGALRNGCPRRIQIIQRYLDKAGYFGFKQPGPLRFA